MKSLKWSFSFKLGSVYIFTYSNLTGVGITIACCNFIELYNLLYMNLVRTIIFIDRIDNNNILLY